MSTEESPQTKKKPKSTYTTSDKIWVAIADEEQPSEIVEPQEEQEQTNATNANDTDAPKPASKKKK